MAFGIVIFPFSWKLDLWLRDHKDILAIGPLRLVLHKKPGSWK
jgi:hypothetical protein